MANEKICPYCKNEIKPLDTHAYNLSNDNKNLTQILVTCRLERYYTIELKNV